MGYDTKFSGVLKFTRELKATELAALSELFGEDCRDHPDWGAKEATYIDLVFTKGFSGIEWDRSTEKTCGLEEAVNIVISLMRKHTPDFGLTGQLEAQGEDLGDRWALAIGVDGFARKEKIVLTGTVVECPHCEKTFLLSDSEKS